MNHLQRTQQNLLFIAILLLSCFTKQLEAENQPIIVFLGDSLTAGYGLSLDEAYPALIQEKIKKLGLNYSVRNSGVSGDTTAAGLRRLNWALKEEPAAIVIALGANDGLRGLDLKETQKNLERIVEEISLKYPAAKIVLAGMELPINMGEEYRQQFRELFPRVARAKDVHLLPFLLENVAGKREFNQSDGIHPTREGQALIAENVWKILKPLL